MFISKRKHNEIVDYLKEEYDNKINEYKVRLDNAKDTNAIISKQLKKLKINLERLEDKNNDLNIQLNLKIEFIKYCLKEREDLQERNRKLVASNGGFTSTKNKISKLTKENEKLREQLVIANQLILEFNKPTKQQARYENPKYNKTDLSKLVDSELKAKKQKVTQYIEQYIEVSE